MDKIFQNLEGKKILILGFGSEGQSTYRIIRSEYPEKKLFVADKKSKEELFKDLSLEIKQDKNLKFILGKDYLSNIGDFDLIIKTPGIPPIKELSITQTEIFFEKCKGRIVGVTGTKGKSTTSTLIYEILKKAGMRTFLIGNIGSPALNILQKENKKETIYVYELSSHQLHELTRSPNIAVVLNIGTDHLDWHGSQADYVTAKRNITLHQKKQDFAILNEDDETVRSFSSITNAKTIFFSRDRLQDKYKKAVSLKGKHNWDNVAASVSVVKLFGIEDNAILSVLQTFKGLEHRLETVRELRGVTFINDSISTNPVSLKAAIESVSEPLTLIMGGFDRGIDYKEIAKAISFRKNIKNILLIGEVAKRMEGDLKNMGYKGNLYYLDRVDMEELAKKAFEMTENGGIVLLSPGAASFDMFKDYKERGKKFKDAVLSLK